MQVSSVTIPNGRIRSAKPLDESKIEYHSSNGLKKLAETRMSRIEIEREESIHDDLVFEYSGRYKEFSGRARKSQAITSIQSSDDEEYKENRQMKKERHDRRDNFQESGDSQDEIDLGEMTSRSKKEMNSMKSNFVFLF